MLNGRVREFAAKTLALSGFSVAMAILSGCGVGSETMANNHVADEGSQTIPAVRISGKVHGGAYPIQNATVILMETQSNGVWTASQGAYVGTAKPLYVTTSDSNGSFNFPDTGWTCDAGQYAYIEVTGGHTAASNNPNVVQLAVVGSCSADLGSKAAIDGINVFLSEPSTVAAAYALHSFLSIHNGNLTGTPSDGSATLSTTIPLADITSASANNAVATNPSINPTAPAPNPASTPTQAVEVPLTSAYNANAIYTDGTNFNSGGFDNDGNAYSASLVPSALTVAGVPYALGPANQQDAVRGGGNNITLTSGSFNTLNILAAGVNGVQTGQTFTVTYTDNTTTAFKQDVSDWYQPLYQNYPVETIALSTSYRNTSSGGKDARTFNIYHYSFPLNKTKTVKRLSLPNNGNVVVLAVTTTNLPSCSNAGSGNSLDCTASGLAHGFQNAYNLVDQVTFNASQFPSGVARTAIPGNSQTVAPREMINTLGNILQECVDSVGGTVTPNYAGYVPGKPGASTHCGDLFYYTTPSSNTSANPTNTLQAVLNIATAPTANVSNLMGLSPRNAFFTPEASSVNNFTVSVFYKGSGLGDTIASPQDLALDGQDNLYVIYGGQAINQNAPVMDELTSAGTGVFSSSLSALNNANSVALDTYGYAWVADGTAASGNVTGFYTSLTAAQSSARGTAYQAITVPNGSSNGLAIDASNNLFITRNSSQNANVFVYTAASSYGTSVQNTVAFPFQRAAVSSAGSFYAVGSSNGSSEWLNYNYASCSSNAPIVSTLATGSATYMAVNNSSGTNANTAFIPSSGQISSYLGGSCSSTTNSTPAGSKNMLATTTPGGAVIDGNLNILWSDQTAGLIYILPQSGASTNINNIAATSFAPCYYTGGACAQTNTAKFQGMAVDSSGALWYLSGGSTYGLVQTLGYAAPTWPLLASENSGAVVQ